MTLDVEYGLCRPKKNSRTRPRLDGIDQGAMVRRQILLEGAHLVRAMIVIIFGAPRHALSSEASRPQHLFRRGDTMVAKPQPEVVIGAGRKPLVERKSF